MKPFLIENLPLREPTTRTPYTDEPALDEPLPPTYSTNADAKSHDTKLTLVHHETTDDA